MATSPPTTMASLLPPGAIAGYRRPVFQVQAAPPDRDTSCADSGTRGSQTETLTHRRRLTCPPVTAERQQSPA